MASSPAGARSLDGDRPATDALTLGRRIRHLRAARGLTLTALGIAVGRAPSQLSTIENGRREPSLALLRAIADGLGVDVSDLLVAAPATHRDALEIEFEQAQRGPLFAALRLPAVRVGRSLPTDALEALVALVREVEHLRSVRAATPEEARRANVELRATMRARDNYFADLEDLAGDLLDAVGHPGGPVPWDTARAMAAHLGFTLHEVADLPHSTRSVIDLRHRRVYIPLPGPGGPTRSVLLQALAAHLLGYAEPADYADFLRQRVEANYLSAAVLMPRRDAVDFLAAAKAGRDLSVRELRDAFAVSRETAAHRFTNLATKHLGIRVHFAKTSESGVLHKAYENDGLVFPTDPVGAVEGQYACRHWAGRAALAGGRGGAGFGAGGRAATGSEPAGIHYQYTDTPAGTYWCAAERVDSPDGAFSLTVGVPFDQVRWFRGRETPARVTSTCPDPGCCRRPPADLARRWADQVWPSARPHASVLAALPSGAFPGVEETEVYEFLEAHAPRAR